MRTAIFFIALATLTLLPAAGVQAATPPANPVGDWMGDFTDVNGALGLLINADGSGGFVATAGQGDVMGREVGQWTFQGTPTGGVLTLSFTSNGVTSRIDLNIAYVDAQTIVVLNYPSPTGYALKAVLHHS